MKYKGKHKYHYFYKITNNINGHFYYGIHSTNNVEDGYMGSGTILLRAYKKYGTENFTKEILKYFNSRKEASDYELEMVNFELIKDKNCYNNVVGGDKYVCVGKVSAFDKIEGIWVLIDVEEFHNNRERYTTVNDGMVLIKSGNTSAYVTKEEYYKNKNKYTTFSSNKVSVKDKNGKYFVVDKNDERIKNGTFSYLQTGVKRSKEAKEKTKETYKKTKHQQRERNSQYGKKWIHKDGVAITIKKELLEKYISEGWKLGRVDKVQKEIKIPAYKTIDPDIAFKLHDTGISWEKVAENLGVTRCVIEKFLREFRKNKK